MTTSDVPTATGIGSPASSASAGTTRKPPPAPTSPVTRPTASPSSTILLADGSRVGPSSAGAPRRPRSIATDVAIIVSANAIISTVLGMCPPRSPPRKAPAIPAAPKLTPVRHRTRPARAWLTAPTAEVTPTTTSEAAIASLAGSPAT